LPAGEAPGPQPYRPRHPEHSAFYKLFEQHFQEYLYAYEERFEPRDGPLRPVVPKVVEAYLACGRPEGGFARIRCPCGVEHTLAFSCSTRNFCPSCQAKRAALFAEKLTTKILADVPHRHFIITIPKALRGLFQRERRLLSLFSQTGYEAIRRTYQAFFDRDDVVPGCISSIQTFGSFSANFHPHLHLLVSEGVFTPEGDFLPLDFIDVKAIRKLFQKLLLVSLHQAERLSESFIERIETWRHSGFSTYAEQVVLPHETERLERLARYITRSPLNPPAVSIDDQGRVHVSTPPHPRTGVTEMVMDPIDWIHLITSQIPDPGLHLTRLYGAYANKVRRTRIPQKPDLPPPTLPATSDDGEDPPLLKARKASWARLLRHIFEVDPLLCPRCGRTMEVISVITDPAIIDRILRHNREKGILSPLEPRPPPAEPDRTSSSSLR